MIHLQPLSRSVRLFYRCLAGFSTAYFLLIAIAGMLVRHRAALQLHSVLISQNHLPYYYHSGSAAVGADRLITDFFVNLLSSRAAILLMDMLAVFWIVGIVTAPVWILRGYIRGRRHPDTRQMPSVPQELRPAAVVGGRENVRRNAKIIKFPGS